MYVHVVTISTYISKPIHFRPAPLYYACSTNAIERYSKYCHNCEYTCTSVLLHVYMYYTSVCIMQCCGQWVTSMSRVHVLYKYMHNAVLWPVGDQYEQGTCTIQVYA